MTHWKLILSYDGTPFHGWQIQPGLATVQGLLSNAIHHTVGERVLPQGSGRTDAGVHALGQVASFAIDAPIPPASLHRALNRCLPPSVRILSAEIVPPSFHARHCALRKTYEYRIFPLRPTTNSGTPHLELGMWDRICTPTLAPYVWSCPWPLDLDALNQAAHHVLGTHDFTTFSAADPDLAARTATELGAGHLDSETWVGVPQSPQEKTPIRTITQSNWHVTDNLIIYRVIATGFLHHMVRNLVGTFVQAGAHRLAPDSVPSLIAGRNRAVAGPTAPASGLFLINVEYPNLEPGPSNPGPNV